MWIYDYLGINLLIKDPKVKLFKAQASKYRLKSFMGQTQGLVKGAKLCLNPYFFGWLEK